MLFTRMRVIFLCFLILAPATSIPAMAAPTKITREGADKLQALFENIIKTRQDRPAQDTPTTESPTETKEPAYQFDGEITVELADSYYAVTLPYITLKNYFGLYDLKIGIIAINVTPHETPGRWNMAIALPPQLFVSNAEGKTMATIDIGAQLTTGVWDETLNYIAASDAIYQDVTITNANNVKTLRLGEITVKTDGLEKSTPAAFSGTTDLALNKLELVNPDLSVTKLGFLKMAAQVEGLERFWEQAMADTAEPAPALPFLDNPPAQMEVRYDVTDFGVFNPKTDETVFALDDLGLRVKGQDLKTDNGMLDIDLNYSGMKSENFLTPLNISDMALAVVVTKIPVLQLLAIQKNAAESESAGLSLMFKIPSVLSQTGTIIRVENSKTVGPDYSGSISAEIQGDITAVNAMTVQGGARVNNMDNFIKRMQGYNGMIAGMLELAKPFAKNSGGEEGQPLISRFTFTMDKTGKVLVNDQDISKPVKDATAATQGDGGENPVPSPDATSEDTAPAR